MKFLTIFAFTVASSHALRIPFLSRIAPTPPPFPPPPIAAYRPEVCSAMDLMCVTNSVKHIAGGPNTLMIKAFKTTLFEQRDLMQDRAAEITDFLPLLLISKAISPVAPNDTDAVKVDALSHTKFASLFDKQALAKTYGAVDQWQQQQAIVNSLHRERAIAMSRISLIDASLASLVPSTLDDEHDDENVQPLLETIQNVLNKEKAAAAAESAEAVGTGEFTI